MTKRPKVGGHVEIGGQIYGVVRQPVLVGETFRIVVENFEGTFQATSEKWRSGKGPWKIVATVQEKFSAPFVSASEDDDF